MLHFTIQYSVNTTLESVPNVLITDQKSKAFMDNDQCLIQLVLRDFKEHVKTIETCSILTDKKFSWAIISVPIKLLPTPFIEYRMSPQKVETFD